MPVQHEIVGRDELLGSRKESNEEESAYGLLIIGRAAGEAVACKSCERQTWRHGLHRWLSTSLRGSACEAGGNEKGKAMTDESLEQLTQFAATEYRLAPDGSCANRLSHACADLRKLLAAYQILTIQLAEMKKGQP